VMNIGSGVRYSNNQIADIVGGEKKYIPARLEPRDSLADITRAKELLNWSPKVSMEEGIGALR
jgi:UDP-glucose 4-epimerase